MRSPPDLPVLAIVGATGAVGRELVSVIDQRRFPFRELHLLASGRSAGTVIACGGQEYVVAELTEQSFEGTDLAWFCAGGAISRRFVPAAVARGATAIDNSSAFRMRDDVPLVVPEINGSALDGHRGPAIIANPNCSTIIALLAATPLHRVAGVERMVVSTYQAVSGAGAAAMAELLEQQARDHVAGRPITRTSTGRQAIFNVYCHESSINADGDNEEETKLRCETRKIWDDPGVRVSATCVRVPVLRAHCASINLTFATPLSEAAARDHLAAAPGVRVVDDRVANRFPEPIDATGEDDVLVGRIRADLSQPRDMGLNLFVAGDQLRKGAALNAVQIAEAVGRVLSLES